MEMEQLTLFPELDIELSDTRPPITANWNLWHGCTKASSGCANCYVYRRDESVGRDPGIVSKTGSFNLPVRRHRAGEHKGRYKIPPGSMIWTCFSSDFFHKAADEWREDAWEMMRERSDCTFFMITKRPERIADHLPADWNEGWDHIQIAVTCENQDMLDKRLPVYLDVPLAYRAVMVEPMLERVNMERYFKDYAGQIQSVSVGGESGFNARPCDYDWVLDLHGQCKEYGVGFHYHQTGAVLIKDGRRYNIPRKIQHSQARKAGLDI